MAARAVFRPASLRIASCSGRQGALRDAQELRRSVNAFGVPVARDISVVMCGLDLKVAPRATVMPPGVGFVNGQKSFFSSSMEASMASSIAVPSSP